MSGPLNSLLKTKLREHALILRALSAELLHNSSTSAPSPAAALATLRAKKEVLMKEVYTVMSETLGVPPLPPTAAASTRFKWDFYDKDGKPGHWEGTPLEFYAIAKGEFSPADSFSLIHDPRNDFGKLYTVDKLGNLWGGRPVLCTYSTFFFSLSLMGTDYRRRVRCQHKGGRPQAGYRQDDQGRRSRLLRLRRWQVL